LLKLFERQHRRKARIAGFVLLGGAQFFATCAAAQAQRQAARHTLIIGMLSGESDYRLVELATPDGTFQVSGFGNARPFETIESTASRILIRLKADERSDSIYPNRIEYRFFANERSLVTAIILEEIDHARVDGAASAQEISRQSRIYRVQPLPPPYYTVSLILYNFSNNILRSRNVRQALAYGINRDEIFKRTLSESGADMLRGPFDEDSKIFAPGMKNYDYDPKKAIALLTSDGWRDADRDNILDRDGQPLRFRLLFPDGLSVEEQMVRQIKIDWLRLGIDVQPIPLTANALNDRLKSGDFDAVLLKHRFEETPESLEAFFGDGLGGGQLKYVNPNYNRTLVSSKRLKDSKTQTPSLQRLQLILNEDQPAAFLYSQWSTYYIFNHAKFDNYLNLAARQIKPFLEWRLRRPAP
jgi:ABC-type transport system substrate-binding protein